MASAEKVTREPVESARIEGKMVPVGEYRVVLYANRLDAKSGETYKIVCFVAPSGWEQKPIKTRSEAKRIALDNAKRLLREGTDVIDIQIHAVPNDESNPD